MDPSKKRNRFLLLAIAGALLIAAIAGGLTWWWTRETLNDHLLYTEDTLAVSSPNGDTQLMLGVEDGRLCYRVERNGTVYMDTSPLGVTVGSTTYGKLSSLEDIGEITGGLRTDARDVNGRVAVADDPCVQALIPIETEATFTLEARVFDNGVAFRYLLPDEGTRTLDSEQTTFALPADSAVWAGADHIYYESIQKYVDPERVSASALGTPATIKLADGGYTAILEGDLAAYPGLKLQWTSKNTYQAALSSEETTLDGAITTPWRILSIADDLNELVNNTILYQVCENADESLFGDDWIQPGRAAWSWITGRTTDRVTPKLMTQYTQYAARLGSSSTRAGSTGTATSRLSRRLPIWVTTTMSDRSCGRVSPQEQTTAAISSPHKKRTNISTCLIHSVWQAAKSTSSRPKAT